MNPTKRNYRATFILDNRGEKDSIETILEGVKNEIAAIQGDITSVDNLGKRDFLRVTDAKYTAGTYVQVVFAAPAQAPTQLKERLRLNNNVYRTFVQSV
jgi:small subunit ribosomal protein S6